MTPAQDPATSPGKESARRDDTPDTASTAVEPAAPAPSMPQAGAQPAPVPVADVPVLAAGGAAAVQHPPAAGTANVELVKPDPQPTPARNISLQVEVKPGETVDIRIAARQDGLNVAVGAGGGEITQSLRQGLGDLESRLAQGGYHAETWHPGHTGPAAETSNNPSNSSSQQQPQQHSGSGWSQQNRGQRENPSNKPKWLNELEFTMNSQPTDKGNENGIGA